MRAQAEGARQLAVSAAEALARAGVAEADVFMQFDVRGIVRYARGELAQSAEIEQVSSLVRVARGRRVVEVRLESCDREALVRALATADRRALTAPETPSFAGFAGAGENGEVSGDRVDEETAAAGSAERAARMAPVVEAVRAAGFYAAGYLETRTSFCALASTAGARRAHASTLASFKVWALETPGAGGASGYGHAMGRSLGALDLAAETERAVRLCQAGLDPIALPPGDYDLVLEPAGVAELLEWLAMTSFDAKKASEGTSLVAGRKGERVMGEHVTLVDDAFAADDLALAAPFDRDGVGRRRVVLIERGVAADLLFDRAWAARLGARSTGHAAPPGTFGAAGPQACALVMSGGSAGSVDELIAGVERGLYVRKLNYVNGALEPRRAVMTGLTRDGTFLIEKGKVTRPVGNMRFTDSLAEASARIDGMTAARRISPSHWGFEGTVACPALRVRRFRFNGGSQERPAV